MLRCSSYQIYFILRLQSAHSSTHQGNYVVPLDEVPVLEDPRPQAGKVKVSRLNRLFLAGIEEKST